MPLVPSHSLRLLLVILGLTVVAGLVRFRHPERLGLEHFDEGIYALTGLWSLNPRGLEAIDPIVIPYAPGGLPFLIGVGYQFLGVSDLAAVAPPLLLGVWTIPVLVWLGRRSFGEGAGVAAAGLAALAGAHIGFSRMALTDVPFLLAWLLALGAGSRFLERPNLARAVALGLAVGLAQWFKYSGWLAGVIVAVAAAAGALVDPRLRSSDRLVRTFGLGMLAAVVAWVAYWPWFSFVEAHGGYGALLEHHRSYLKGFAAWPSHWTLQQAQAVALGGRKSFLLAGWILAVAAVWVAYLEPGRPRQPGWVLRSATRLGALGIGAIAFSFVPTFPWWVAAMSVPWLLRDARPAVRLQGVAFLVLAVLTPFYHPYARLWLPLQAASWLILGGLIREVALPVEPGQMVWGRGRWAVGLGAALLAAGTLFLSDPRPQAFDSAVGIYPDHAGLAGYRRENLERFGIAGPTGASPTVYARPSVLFQLLTDGGVAVRRAGDLGQALKAAASGGYAIVDEALVAEEDLWQIHDPAWSSLPLATEELGGVTTLDHDPAAAYGEVGRRSVRVWLLRPPG